MTGLAAQINEGVSAATGNSTAGSFLQQGLMTAAYNIRGGKGFKDDYSSLNWGVFNPGASQLGSMIGGMALQSLKEKADRYGAEQNRSRMPETPGDPLGTTDNLLGAMWYGMRKLEESVSNMYTSVLDTTGLGNVIDTVNSWADTSRSIFGVADNLLTNIGGAIGAGIMGAASWVKDTAVSAWSGITGAVSSAVGAVQKGVSDFFVPKVVIAPEVQTAGWVQDMDYYTDNSDLDSRARADEKLGSYLNNNKGVLSRANAEAVKNIFDKHANGEKITAEDFKALTMTMLQKSTLPVEIIEAMQNDAEAFNDLAGRTFNFGGKGSMELDLTNPESIRAYAEKISELYCVTASQYSEMVGAGINGTPGSFGEFTKELFAKGLIDPSRPAQQIKPTQEIIDAFAGKGAYEVVGYGVDRGGGYFNDENGNNTASYGGTEILKQLQVAAKQNYDVKIINVYVNNGGRLHNMNLFNDKGSLSIYDTSFRGVGTPISQKYIKDSNIQSWYYVRPVRRK